MGYTHYWRELKTVDESEYRVALGEIRALIAASPVPLFGGDGCDSPEVEGYISFNGDASKGEDHETFYLETSAVQNGDFEFCKTAYKPYDLMVTAALAVLADRCRGVQVSSDGNNEDWKAGVKFASKTLGRIIRNPIRKAS